MAETDWRIEQDPQTQYRTDQLHWRTTDQYTAAFGISTDEMIAGTGTWALDY